MKLEFSRLFFEKFWNIKFNENPSSGSRRTDGGTGKDNEAKSRFSQYCERAYKFVGRIITNVLNAEIWSTKKSGVHQTYTWQCTISNTMWYKTVAFGYCLFVIVANLNSKVPVRDIVVLQSRKRRFVRTDKLEYWHSCHWDHSPSQTKILTAKHILRITDNK
jgi:hypothetical protein